MKRMSNSLFPRNTIFPKALVEEAHVKSQSSARNVHINPNFKPQGSTMHINPKIHAKPLIHVNPKMMHNIASSSQNLQNNVTNATRTDIDSNIVQANIKRSIYVNPTLLRKLSSSKVKPANLTESVATRRISPVKLMSVESTDKRKVTLKKTSDPSVVLLSRRKLVRVAHNAYNVSETSAIAQCRLQKSVDLIAKKPNLASQKIAKLFSLTNNTLRSANVKSNFPKSSSSKSKMSRYKIDRTALCPLKIKEDILQKVKGDSSRKIRKVINNTMELITIGGIVYRSSKNRLVRRSCSLKQKRLNSGNNDKPVVTNNSKKSRRSKGIMNRTLETSISSKTRLVSPKAAYKNNISNKVKQRSIQILRNKMCKNNQPCLIFQRFGYCLNHKNGMCPKRHDKKQVSICKKFLQGKCFSNECPLSHDIGPEKMPTCKYFLDGCCTKDACPYLHVKVSSNTSICIDFLQGYCAKGNECQRRHEYVCPEFDKLRNCSKGKYCPYPHKSHLSNVAKTTKYVSKTRDLQKHEVITSVIKEEPEISNSECRLRYYERSDNNVSDDFERKKKNILRKIEIMKNTLNNDQTVDSANEVFINETKESLVKENKDESMLSVKDNIKKRLPIGSLPAYIPID